MFTLGAAGTDTVSVRSSKVRVVLSAWTATTINKATAIIPMRGNAYRLIDGRIANQKGVIQKPPGLV
jgi:formylmethanofuran dehydrogenase subunit D